MVQFYLGYVREKVKEYSIILIAISFTLSGLMPIILEGQANAAQLLSRSVTISNSNPGTSANYTFNFTLPTTSAVQGIRFEFCTTALSTCTKPTGLDLTSADINATQTFSVATAFSTYTGADSGTCDNHNSAIASTEFCISRTAGTAESAAAKTVTIDGIVNPTIAGGTNNTSVYVRVYLYSDTAYSTLAHEGTVAAAITQQITVSGRVQERLVFCVFALEDADALPTSCTDAVALESTAVDLGIVDNLSVARAPVDNSPPGTIGNDRYGAAMINTNASNGVAVTYYAAAAGSGTNELRAFRVSGVTCDASGTSVTDQCFRSAAEDGSETITLGAERFGMQIACIANSAFHAAATTANLGKTAGAYVFGSGSSGSVNTAYDAGRASMDDGTNDDCENGATGADAITLSDKYAWNDTGSAQALVSSTAVVDNEIIKMKYAATANATTPTGTYTVASTYIATPTF
jgi:hypothetical protein